MTKTLAHYMAQLDAGFRRMGEHRVTPRVVDPTVPAIRCEIISEDGVRRAVMAVLPDDWRTR